MARGEGPGALRQGKARQVKKQQQQTNKWTDGRMDGRMEKGGLLPWERVRGGGHQFSVDGLCVCVCVRCFWGGVGVVCGASMVVPDLMGFSALQVKGMLHHPLSSFS